jgi:signal transduction histidine kinase/CheY-like chemotaxis protein/CHASE3 domain sensor protein
VKTRTVLLATFGLLLALVTGRAIIAIGSFRDAIGEYDALVRQHARADEALARVTVAAIDLESGVRGFALTGDAGFLEPYERASAQIGGAIDRLGRETAGGGDAAAVARIRAGLERWEAEFARPLIAATEAGAGERQRALRAAGKRHMDAVRADLDGLRAALASAREGEAASVRAFERRFAVEASATGAITVALMIAAWLFVLRNVDAPLARLARYAEGSEKGAALASVGGVEEVRVLAGALDEMARRTREELAREQRFAELVMALSAGGSVAAVAAAALRWVVNERSAAAGVLWVARGPDAPLEPAAAFGLDVSGLAPGASALAREAREAGEARRLGDVGPGAYHVVRSAVADVVPRALLAAPVRAGAAVVGVVELAGPLAAGDEDAFERSLLRVGLALQHAVSQERAETLRLELAAASEEQRLQNEELRLQQEELRAQGDELAAQKAELADRNEALQRASRAKSDFLSTMSHELRTPLNAVLGFADVLLDGAYGALDGPQRAAVGDIRDAGRQLLTLVNDILDLAKIEAGRLDVSIGPVDAADSLADAFGLLESSARRKGLRFERQAPEAPLVCAADRDRLRQVLVNLASNAIKFTPPGGSIALRASAAPGRVRFEVADTGVGISADDQARLFQPFVQAESGRAQRNVGTGLGLSICRHLVGLMGGEIGLSSEPGRGSTFYFTLPLAGPAGADAGPAAAPPPPARPLTPRLTPAPVRSPAVAPGARRKALVVDDDPMHARVAESVLARGGYEVAREASGEAALARLDRERPDLLVVDLGLPGMSGAALLEQVRGRRALRRLPVVVLTARDLDAEESRELGRLADLVAQKGVMTEGGFLSSLEGLLARPRGASVLVVDDNEANRRVVRALTASAGYHILEADGGEAGLELARRERPDVVLMDVRMPDVDGLEATRRLRADGATRDIPVVAVSAQAMVGDRERALEAGCVDYVTKPVSRHELLDALARALAAPPPPPP